MFSSVFLNCPWVSKCSLLFRGGGQDYENKRICLQDLARRLYCKERVNIIPVPKKTTTSTSVYRRQVPIEFPDFPEEILLFILSYLTKEDVLSVSMVCQKLFNLVIPLKLNNTIEVSLLEQPKRRGSSQNEIDGRSHVSLEDILKLKQVCDSVSHFMICRQNFMPFEEKLKRIRNDISLNNETTGIFLMCKTNSSYSRTWDFDKSYDKAVNRVLRVTRSCSLSGLYINHFVDDLDEVIEKILQTSTDLTEFGCVSYSISNASINSLATTCKGLKKVLLRQNYKINDIAIKNLVASCKWLETLD